MSEWTTPGLERREPPTRLDLRLHFILNAAKPALAAMVRDIEAARECLMRSAPSR